MLSKFDKYNLAFDNFLESLEKVHADHNGFEIKTLKQWEKNVSHKSTLDLGAGITFSPYLLYCSHNFHSYLGIDNKSIDYLIKKFIEDMEPAIKEGRVSLPKERQDLVIAQLEEIRKSQLLYDVYKLMILAEEGKYKNIEKTDFQKIFRLKDNTSIIDFINLSESQSEKFDLIFASNSLHFLEERRKVIVACRFISEELKEEGHFYIRVKYKPGGSSNNNLYEKDYRNIFNDAFKDRFGSKPFITKNQDPQEGWALTCTNLITDGELRQLQKYAVSKP